MIFQLIFLIFFAIAIIVLFKNKWLAIIASAILSLFIVLEFTAVSLSESLINYRFYEHMSLGDIWSVKEFYSTQIIIGTIAFLVFAFLMYKLNRFLNKRNIPIYITIIIAIITLTGLIIPDDGIVKNIVSIYEIKNAEEKTFITALQDVGINTEKYITADKIEATAGKNIIVISLESLERGYLEPPLDHLTPTLNSLANKHGIKKMKQNLGSDWTAASIYTSITGVPSYFRAPKNEEFKNTKITNLGNLGTVLQKGGYDMTYFLARKEFSGLDVMLSHFGFEVKSEADLPYPKSNGFWGLQDKELFEAAADEIISKSKKEKPFAVFLNTISGHFPKGVYDARMEGVLPPQNSDLEFMATAVDYYIDILFKKLKDNDILENTVVYIYPDHLFMSNIYKEIKNFPKERELFLITTAADGTIDYPERTLYQIDIPKVIIEGAEIKTNATFLADYIKKEDVNSFIQENTTNILAINEPIIERYNFSKNIIITKEGERSISIAQEDGFKKTIEEIEMNQLYRVYFDTNMNIIKIKRVKEKEAFWRGETAGVIFSVKEDFIYSYLLKGKKIGVARKGEKQVIFNQDDLAIFDDWTLLQPKKEYNNNTLYLNSVGYNSRIHRGASFIKTGKQNHTLKRGINIIFATGSTYQTRNFDTYESKKNIKKFISFTDSLLQTNKSFAIVLDDTVGKKIDNYEDELNDLGLTILPKVKNREAYVAIYDKELKYFIEETHPKSILKEAKLSLLKKDSKESLKGDVSRFIAHAGGKINGKIYTNSLEALNENYNKGFRYFELDIISTKDGKYVAAHDWKMWQKKTNYSGTLPPTEAIFKNQKIYDTYTPLTLTDINDWFSNHTDAILVTDKVEDPEKFIPLFVAKDRLMMELFSESAIDKAAAFNIKGVLISNNIIRKNRDNIIQFLKEKNAKYLAVSRKYASENQALFQKIKDQGIKTYVYHVNFEKGKDETYVFDYEIGLVYGMYADQWQFPLNDKQDTE